MIFFGQNNGPQPNLQESLEFFRRKFLNYTMSCNLEQKTWRKKTNFLEENSSIILCPVIWNRKHEEKKNQGSNVN